MRLRAVTLLTILAGLAVLVGCGSVGESMNAVATQGAAVAATAQAAATQAAPAAATAAAVGGQVAATAQAAATQVVPAAATAAAGAQAAATQVAPAAATAAAGAQVALATARAAATEVAPALPTAATAVAGALATMQAVLTQGPASVAATLVATPVVVPGIGSVGPIQIASVEIGAAGIAVTLRNGTPFSVDLSGWGLRVDDTLARLPAGTRLPAGGALTVRVGAGGGGPNEVNLGEPALALLGSLRPGARIALIDAEGRVVSEFALPS